MAILWRKNKKKRCVFALRHTFFVSMQPFSKETIAISDLLIDFYVIYSYISRRIITILPLHIF